MSMRTSRSCPAEQQSRFICSPLGSAVSGQCHCSPAMNCSCGPNDSNDPLMYFRYSDCNTVADCSEDECSCQPCGYSTGCNPKRPVHMQMSCSGTPNAGEWKRFHNLKRHWVREKSRKKARRSTCNASSCHLPDPNIELLQKHGAATADEVCASALGIPAHDGSNVPILDPHSWRIARVMTSAGTFCPHCCRRDPTNLDVNFGVTYCGPSPHEQIVTQPPTYAEDADSYLSHGTRFDVPYRASEEMKSGVNRRPTPFPKSDVMSGSNQGSQALSGNSRMSGARPYYTQEGSAVRSQQGSYIGGGSRIPEEPSPYPANISLYHQTGQSFYDPSSVSRAISGMQGSRNRSQMPGSVYSRPASGLGSNVPKFSEFGSYREPEPSGYIVSGKNVGPDPANYAQVFDENEDMASGFRKKSVYSAFSKQPTHLSYLSQADGRSGGSRSVHTTMSNAKSHRSRKPSLEEQSQVYGIPTEEDPSHYIARTNPKSQYAYKTHNPSVYAMHQELPSPFKRIPNKSYVSYHHTVKNASKGRDNKSRGGKSYATTTQGVESQSGSESNDSYGGSTTNDDTTSSVVTALKLSEHSKSQEPSSPVSRRSHKSRRTH